MSNKKQPHDQPSRISCIVCEQQLPPPQYVEQDEPPYFPSSSSGYKAGQEPDRNCEDIAQLLRFLSTLNEAIWAQIGNLEGGDRDIENIRGLCTLFDDLKEEMGRRFKQLNAWVEREWQIEQQHYHESAATHYGQLTPRKKTLQ